MCSSCYAPEDPSQEEAFIDAVHEVSMYIGSFKLKRATSARFKLLSNTQGRQSANAYENSKNKSEACDRVGVGMYVGQAPVHRFAELSRTASFNLAKCWERS